MSDILLFRVTGQVVSPIQGKSSDLEKPLQTLIEANLEPLLAVRFLATEYRTGEVHNGRIDTLGIDEDNCPVIIEYKRSSSENVINQGLFYLDWLMDHRAEFKLLVLESLGKPVVDDIDWSSPRLICIAAEFTRYDSHAIQQMKRNIDLIRYRRFGSDLLLFELVNTTTAAPEKSAQLPAKNNKSRTAIDKPANEWLASLPPALAPVFDSLSAYILSLGDDVQRKDLRPYIAFKRMRNFVWIAFYKTKLRLYLRLDPMLVKMEEGFTRDVSGIGHAGTGDTEITISNLTDLENAKPYLQQAYEGGSYASKPYPK